MQLIKTTYPRFGSKTVIYARGLGYWRESLKERYALSYPFVEKLIEHRAIFNQLGSREILSALSSICNVFGPFRSGDPTFTPVNRRSTWSLKNLFSFIFSSLTTTTYSGTRLNVSPLYPNGNVDGSDDQWKASIASIILAKTFVSSKIVELSDSPADHVIYVLNNKKIAPAFFSESASETSLLTLVGVPRVRDALTAYFESLSSTRQEGGAVVLNDYASRIATEYSRIYIQITRALTEIQMSMASTYRVISTLSQNSPEANLPHHVAVASKWYDYYNSFFNFTSFVPYTGEAPSEADYRIADDFANTLEKALSQSSDDYVVVNTIDYFMNALTISEVNNIVMNAQQKGYLIEWASPSNLDINIEEVHYNNENGRVSGFVDIKDELTSSMRWASLFYTDLIKVLREALKNSTFMAENMSEGFLDLTDSAWVSPYGDEGDLIKRGIAVVLSSNISFDGVTWVYESQNMIKNMYVVSHFAGVDFQTEDPSRVVCVNAPSYIHEGMSLYKHPNLNTLIDKKWLKIANIEAVTSEALQLTVSFSEQLQELQGFSIPSCEVTLHSPSDFEYAIQMSRFKLLCHEQALINAYGLYALSGLNMNLVDTTTRYLLRLINVSTNVSESAYTGLKIYKRLRNVALTYFGKTATLLTVGLTSPINQSIISYNASDANFSIGLQYNIAHNAIMLILRGFEELGLQFSNDLRTLVANTERRFETSILMEA